MKDNIIEIKHQLIEAEKMASLGHLIAGIAHEINTPIGAIKATIESIISKNQLVFDLYDKMAFNFSKDDRLLIIRFLKETCFLNPESYISTREKRQLKKSLIEELKKEGFTSALQYIDYFQSICLKKLTPATKEILQHPNCETILKLAHNISVQTKGFETINTAIDKVSKIVYALKSYSRLNETEDLTEFSLIENIQIILTLYSNHLKYNIDLKEHYDPVAPLIGFPNDLGQVWTNLIHNALQAMEYQGKLFIEVKDKLKHVSVSISDNGPGIPSEIQNKIFDPFFTTKIAGEGTGLGLDIVQKIIYRHGGSIQFISEPGSTVFTVDIPKKEFIKNEIAQRMEKESMHNLDAAEEKRQMMEKIEKQLEARENITRQMIKKFKNKEAQMLVTIKNQTDEIEKLKAALALKS